jgi:hypothetical protein
MNIGIVGAEGAKFTPLGEQRAKEIIYSLLPPGSVMVSGHCHLGGIDIWAEEAARSLGLGMKIHEPKRLIWDGGFKQRNLLIASDSDIVHCIAVDRLPADFKGLTHPLCYHCDRKDHVKSGGCWTMKKAKLGQLHIVSNF